MKSFWFIYVCVDLYYLAWIEERIGMRTEWICSRLHHTNSTEVCSIFQELYSSATSSNRKESNCGTWRWPSLYPALLISLKHYTICLSPRCLIVPGIEFRSFEIEFILHYGTRLFTQLDCNHLGRIVKYQVSPTSVTHRATATVTSRRIRIGSRCFTLL